jgi:SAM-dependent methyltransferase
MDNGWQQSADAWIAEQGDHGDFGRRWVLDPVMLPRALAAHPRTALDVGCGEGRFCRLLARHGVQAAGIDPTPALIQTAQQRHPAGRYLRAAAEAIPFRSGAFDLVVSYLSLIDIPGVHAAIAEMARILRPGGSLLIASLTNFNTAAAGPGWVRDPDGTPLHFALDGYLEEREVWMEYRGIRVVNHHRPLSVYFQALLAAGLRLVHFDEPAPIPGAPERKAAKFRRAPNFLVMEWRLDGAPEIEHPSATNGRPR